MTDWFITVFFSLTDGSKWIARKPTVYSEIKIELNYYNISIPEIIYNTKEDFINSLQDVRKLDDISSLKNVRFQKEKKI